MPQITELDNNQATPQYILEPAQNQDLEQKALYSREARPVLGFRLIQGRAKRPSLAPCMVSPASHVGHIL